MDARRRQLLEYISSFSKDFDVSLEGLNTEEQLTITRTLKKIIPLFIVRPENYYQTFYQIYETEILETLRDKARVIYSKRLPEYFDIESLKFMTVMHEKGFSSGDLAQELSDEEFESFISSANNLVNLKHQMLLITKPDRIEKKEKINSEKIEQSIGDPEIKPLGEREEYMSIDECAKFLDCSKVTIHEYKKQGMPHYQIGRTVKFKKSEVLNFMRQQKKNKNRK